MPSVIALLKYVCGLREMRMGYTENVLRKKRNSARKKPKHTQNKILIMAIHKINTYLQNAPI